MCPPEQRLPGKVYLVTRRTERRHLLFRPDGQMNRLFRYCLALAARKTGIVVHAVVLMSNHYHLVLTDPFGRVTELTEELNWLLTKTTQCLRGWVGRVFDGAKPSYVELLTPDAIVDKIAYVLANPVEAGLVRYGREWPGVRTRVADMGAPPQRTERPDCFFAEDGKLSEAAALRFELPDVLVDLHGVEGARQRLAEAVERREEALRAEARAANKSFMGATRVRKASPYGRAKTYEPRHGLDPRLAAGGDKETLEERKRERREFQEHHEWCRTRWFGGERDLLWPAGTDHMRRRHGVRCADPPN